MVRPKSKKSISRRSSILKTPVVQQPLQHVKGNVSLHQEYSITIKQKRRVSFADKKHIKEFCDSVEQGTLWDNTYEESSSENSKEINLNNQSYKSIIVYNDTSSLNDIDDPELNKTCTQDVSMEITEIPYIIECKDNVPMTHKQLFEDKENIPMCNIINKSNDLAILQNKINKVSDKTQYFCAEQLSFTECQQSVIKPAEFQGRHSKVIPFTNDEQLTNEKTEIFQDVPMEITCVIPLIERKNCIDQTIIFHDTPMDNTMVVIPITNKKEIANPIDISEMESNRTESLNASMEITNQICSVPHSKIVNAATDAMDILNYRHSSVHNNKNTQSNDDTMEFTTAVTNLPPITEWNKCTIQSQTRLSSESTKIFQNELMEITESLHVPKILHNNDIQQVNDTSINSLVNNEDVMLSKTQIFQNESMEITKSLHVPRILHNNDIQQANDTLINSLVNNEDVMLSKTHIFQDESMTVTEPLHTSNILHNNDIQQVNDTSINSLVNNEDVLLSKTQIFQDESMAITVPLQASNILHNNDIQQVNDTSINSLLNNEDIASSNTRIFQNMSMEITSVVTNLPILPNSSKLCKSTEKDSVNLNINEKKDETIVNNEGISGIINTTTDSSATNYNEDCEDSSTEPKPVNALTSLITSFVYADMIEDDSFFKTISENELSMKDNIEQERKCQQYNINANFTVDTVNVDVENIQSSDQCTVRNKEALRKHESSTEHHHEDNNIQEENVMVNREENNQCNQKLSLSKSIEINEDIFERGINHKTMCDISTEIQMIEKNKQLNETKKDIERNSETYIIKPKKNSVMNIDKYTDDRCSSNQIIGRSSILSPTLCSASITNEMSITENNLIANLSGLSGNMNLNDFYEKENCNNSSLNEDVEHVISHEKPKKSSTFFSLVHQLKTYMSSNDCIWDLYFEDIDKQMLVISFISTSLLIVIFTQNNITTATCPIKRIDIISRLENDENVQLSIAHKLIKEKINIKYVNQLYRYDEGFVPLLNHISEDVKLVLDFIFDLKQLDNTNLMEINTERITFIARSKYMNIVLEVTMDVKLFDKIDSSNINIICILGTVRKEDIKELIINIKRDHKFLRRFMSDIKGYIDIIEQANLVN